ncbi:MAG TPA: hypothetical protein VF623_02345, partial [Segetibacter sp.]
MKSLLCILAFLTPVFLFSQRNFQPGYVVTFSSDTVRGFIDYKEWNNTPTEIIFKPGKTDEGLMKFDLQNMRCFEVLGKEAYQRFIVKISLDPVALDDIDAKDTSSRVDTVFLKVLVEGNVLSLFSYTDRI